MQEEDRASASDQNKKRLNHYENLSAKTSAPFVCLLLSSTQICQWSFQKRKTQRNRNYGWPKELQRSVHRARICQSCNPCRANIMWVNYAASATSLNLSGRRTPSPSPFGVIWKMMLTHGANQRRTSPTQLELRMPPLPPCPTRFYVSLTSSLQWNEKSRDTELYDLELPARANPSIIAFAHDILDPSKTWIDGTAQEVGKETGRTPHETSCSSQAIDQETGQVS